MEYTTHKVKHNNRQTLFEPPFNIESGYIYFVVSKLDPNFIRLYKTPNENYYLKTYGEENKKVIANALEFLTSKLIDCIDLNTFDVDDYILSIMQRVNKDALHL
jgi:hypothetical protein